MEDYLIETSAAKGRNPMSISKEEARDYFWGGLENKGIPSDIVACGRSIIRFSSEAHAGAVGCIVGYDEETNYYTVRLDTGAREYVRTEYCGYLPKHMEKLGEVPFEAYHLWRDLKKHVKGSLEQLLVECWGEREGPIEDVARVLRAAKARWSWNGWHVPGSLYLQDLALTRLPQIAFVSQNFSCSNNLLSSLKGSPAVLMGDFTCSANKLSTLIGGPTQVGNTYSCARNQLRDLRGAPKKVKNFICSFNQLTSLKGAPTEINCFNCSHNDLTSLEGVPKKLFNLNCVQNRLTSLKKGPEHVSFTINCTGNPLESFECQIDPKKIKFDPNITPFRSQQDLVEPKEPQEEPKEPQEEPQVQKEPYYTAKEFEAIQNSGSRGFPIGGLKPLKPKEVQKEPVKAQKDFRTKGDFTGAVDKVVQNGLKSRKNTITVHLGANISLKQFAQYKEKILEVIKELEGSLEENEQTSEGCVLKVEPNDQKD